MTKSNLPKLVPLPEVPHYTEDITFGNLALPQGLDEERLLVNVRGINRIRSAAGLGTVSVVGKREETSTYDYGVTGIDSSGAATFSASRKSRKASIAKGSLTFPTPSSIIGKPQVTISVNTAEVEEKIKNHGESLANLYQPAPRAKILNQAVRCGLRDAAIDANVDRSKMMLAARWYGFSTILGLSMNASPGRMLVISGVFGPIMLNMAVLRDVSFGNLQRPKEEELSPLAVLKELRQSLFVGAAADRIAAASVLTGSQRLIKARS